MSSEKFREAAVKIIERFGIALVVAPRLHQLMITIAKVVGQQADGVTAKWRARLDKLKCEAGTLSF